METLYFDPSARLAKLPAGSTMVAPRMPSDTQTRGAPEPRVEPDTSAPTADSARAGGGTTVLPHVEDDNGQVRLTPRQDARYGTLRSLGVGGMGEVDLVEDLDIGRSVAIKRLPHGGDTPLAVARFVDEVRTMGALDHPNITPIYDVGRDDKGRYFFAMKYIDGESLESLIDRLAAGDPAAHTEYPIARRLDIFSGIVHALDYAHARGVVHHDIKPANVMLGQHGEVHLVDWGIAGRAGGTPSRGIQGTPMYMSPEQARGGETDARSDLYSAFVVLFELLTLRTYIRTQHSGFAILQAVLEAEVPSGDAACWSHPQQAALPTELRHFVRHGLKRDREQRFATAAEATASLERLRSGDIIVECPVTAFKAQQARVTRFADRRPMLLLGLMMLGVLGSAGVLVLASMGLSTLLS